MSGLMELCGLEGDKLRMLGVDGAETYGIGSAGEELALDPLDVLLVVRRGRGNGC